VDGGHNLVGFISDVHREHTLLFIDRCAHLGCCPECICSRIPFQDIPTRCKEIDFQLCCAKFLELVLEDCFVLLLHQVQQAIIALRINWQQEINRHRASLVLYPIVAWELPRTSVTGGFCTRLLDRDFRLIKMPVVPLVVVPNPAECYLAKIFRRRIVELNCGSFPYRQVRHLFLAPLLPLCFW
jgi:hypothetical protein